MIRIHHARRTRSARVIWLLEELGVPYELAKVEFTPESLRSPAHLKLHPLGQVPAVEIDGIVMFESGAILEFLLERYGNGRLAPPPATNERAEYLKWFHFGEASLAVYMTMIVRNRFGKTEATRLADVVTESRAHLRAAIELVELTLGQRAYITGSEFSAADIMVSYGIVMARITGELPAEFRNVAEYLTRLKERPAYGRAWA